jgi:hypothetical protein
LVADLRDTDSADFIEHRNHITVQREHGRADRDFDVGICLMQRIQARQNLIVRDVLTV